MIRINKHSLRLRLKQSFSSNKNLFVFASLISLVGISSLVFLQKLSPLISHTAYYCQSFINSLSMPIPYYLGIIPFSLFFVFLLIAIIKLLIIYIKVQLLRSKLTKNFKTDRQFNSLLEKLQLINKTYLIESEKQFAFCLGIRHPRIYISTSLVNGLTIQEIEAVLRHERYHLNNRDTLTMLIASIGESLLPFFPIISDFLYNYRVEREIRADGDAVQGLGDEKPLIAVLKKLLRTPAYAAVTASSIADHDTLEPRIHALIRKDVNFKRFKVKHVFISLASVFIMSIITIAPVQAMEIHHNGEDAMMLCPKNDICINACRKIYSPTKKNYSEDTMYTPMP